MKQLILILTLAPFLLLSCGKDDKNVNKDEQWSHYPGVSEVKEIVFNWEELFLERERVISYSGDSGPVDIETSSLSGAGTLTANTMTIKAADISEFMGSITCSERTLKRYTFFKSSFH